MGRRETRWDTAVQQKYRLVYASVVQEENQTEGMEPQPPSPGISRTLGLCSDWQGKASGLFSVLLLKAERKQLS